MPNHKSAEKRDRQNERRREVNRRNRSRLRTEIKKIRVALTTGKKQEAGVILANVISLIDKSAKKGIIHKNAASRYKSRLTVRFNALSA
ncbi:MAG: 30S ribosomal protein S20 [Blastocatellia bacterium]|nr:30S ribosomal protein S20 [Blastocatellia bacterium]